MCGIIGYIGFENPKNVLIDGLRRLEYRGYDSAGIALSQNNTTQVYRSEGRIQNLENKIASIEMAATRGIGHTRWATHGAPNETNAHPHKIGSITLVHNGIIENYLELKRNLQQQGRKFESETDTETVAHLLDIQIQEGSSLISAVVKTLPKLKGSYAFVISSEKEPDLIIGIRNGAPLLLGIGKNQNFIASDVQAILHRTKEIVYLEDKEFAICTKDKVSVHDFTGKEKKFEVKTIRWSPEQTEKAGYRHYMLKEIHEQPMAIAQTIEGHINHHEGIIQISELADKPDFLKGIKRLSLVACGTARHAGLIGKYYFERFAKLPSSDDYASEFRYREPMLDSETLLILISQSGETADTLAALREAKSRGVKTLAICNVRESTLTREADLTLYTNAGPEIGVASTKAFTSQVTMLYILAVDFGIRQKVLNKDQAYELTQDLLKLPMLAEKVITSEKLITEIAASHQPFTFFFYIGRDVNYPIALEGALKLKEISYAHAEGYPAGEIKHGPIALIDRESSVIVIAPKDNSSSETLYDKTISNLQEVKSRGGKIFSIATEGDEEIAHQSDYLATIPKASWGLNPILVSIPLQFFAYFMALQRGTDVDKPRNLAKSVTVE